MSQRIALLVGTRKGLFVLDGDADRDEWHGPRPDVRRLADPRRDRRSGDRRHPRRRRQQLVRPGGLAERRPRRDVEPLERGHDLRRRRREDRRRSGASRPGPGDAMYAGVEPAGLFRSADGGATWQHVEGLTNHPSRPEWQPGNGGLILHSIVPSPDDADRVWVGISSVGAFETADGGATWQTAERGRAGRLHARGPAVPRLRPVRAQARHGRGRRRAPLPAEPLRRVSLDRRRQAVGGDHAPACRPSSASRWAPTRAIRRRSGRSRSTEPEDGRLMVDGHAAVWRTNDGGDTWIRSDDGLPTARRLRRRPARGDGGRPARPGRGLLRHEHGPAVRQPRRGPAPGASSPTTCRPIWSVEAAVVG